LKSLKLRKKKKLKKNVLVMDVPLVGRHVVEHGLKKGKFAIAERKKMKSGSFIYWVRTHWLGAML
jgi:hypothetical protein